MKKMNVEQGDGGKWYKLQEVSSGTIVVISNRNNNKGKKVPQVEQQEISCFVKSKSLGLPEVQDPTYRDH